MAERGVRSPYAIRILAVKVWERFPGGLAGCQNRSVWRLFPVRRIDRQDSVAIQIPMRLLGIPEAFDHPEFVYEPKLDGFRALAYVTGHRCELVSRNGQRFKSWPQLAEEIAHAVQVDS